MGLFSSGGMGAPAVDDLGHWQLAAAEQARRVAAESALTRSSGIQVASSGQPASVTWSAP